AVADASKRGEVGGMMSVDAVTSVLVSGNALMIVADTRSEEGTRQVYGGLYPGAVLYLTPAYAEAHPEAVESLVNVFVRTLRWIGSHSPEEIAKVLPAEHALGNPEIFIRSIRASL